MQPTAMLPKLTETTQTITFSEEEDGCNTTGEVYATDVVVSTNAGTHSHGSSKVKLKSLVDYNWEPRLYTGQLLAVHVSGKYLAYCIKAPNAMNPGTWCGMVRVVYNPEPGTDRRALIKGMKGEVQDLAFAHIQSEVVLACIDEQGNFYVHEIEVTDSGLRCTLLVEIREDTGAGGGVHRVVWCPYIPDEDDDSPDDDVARLLLTTHGNIARMWNIRGVSSRFGSGGEWRGTASALLGTGGSGGGSPGLALALAAAEHNAPVVDAAFSPDGTALATASADGYVMFFQVYMASEGSPRCLHKWQPHGGKPLSCLFFLDNHKNYNTDVQFWKFAVTGAESNTVIKIWSCKSWNCLQTITFTPSIGSDSSLGLRAMLDTSASFLLLSDFRSRSLYVLNMARDKDDTMAYCKSIAEYLLPYPVLSFCIIDAEEEAPTCGSACDSAFERNGSSCGSAPLTPRGSPLGPAPQAPSTRLRLYIVQPKGLQEGELVYTPPVTNQGNVHRDLLHEEEAPSTRLRLYIVQPKGLQEGELVYTPPVQGNMHRDLLHDLSELNLGEPERPPSGGDMSLQSSILQQQSAQLKSLLLRSQPQPQQGLMPRADSPPQPLNLMTPDAFSSPGKRDEEDPPLSGTPDVGGSSRVSLSTGSALPLATLTPLAPLAAGLGVAGSGSGVNAGASREENKLTSGGSSPSREVQQIMAHNDDIYKPHMEEESSQTPVAEEDTSSVIQNGTDAVFATGNLFADQTSGKLAHSGSDTSWPQISLAQITEANQRKASSDKSSSQSLNNSLNVSTAERVGSEETRPPPTTNATTSSAIALAASDRLRLEALEHKLDKLCDLLLQQGRDLRALRQDVQAPRKMLDDALTQHAARTTAAIESALQDGWERIARSGEAAGSRAAAAAGLGAARALEPLAAALQHELASKLTATDHLLRDNIDKLATSKTVMERLSTSIAKSLSDMVRDSFRAALFESVVPVMEKAHAQIFRQINQAFQTGTKEFAANTEAAARAAAERGGAAATAALRAALDRHAEALHTAVPPQHVLAQTLKEVTHSVLEKEMLWWREQARSVAVQMSRAHSPATPATSHSSAIDRQMQVAQIQSLMSGGDVNGAFQLALSAADLTLVVSACRSAEPARVFGPPCQLKQHVLLSLVQQLAADLRNDTDTALKHRYLEEAVMNLDTTNPVTREHLPGVVRELQKQIVAFLNGNPSHAQARQFKMLLMATESLVKSAV